MDLASMDIVNGTFELVGGYLTWKNVIQIRRDRMVAGVQIAPFVFFAIWGYWNLFYYPALAQPLSTIGALMLAVGNTIWVVLAIHYRDNETEKGGAEDEDAV